VARLGISGLEPARLALGLSQAAAYSHVARLSREGLPWRVRIGDGAGGVVAVTHAWARTARAQGSEGVVSARSAAPSSGRHGRAVSWLATSLSLRDRGGGLTSRARTWPESMVKLVHGDADALPEPGSDIGQ
jgi:hypothetical protein